MPAENQEQEKVLRAAYRGHWASEEQGTRLASAVAEALLSCSREVICVEKATREGKMKTFPNLQVQGQNLSLLVFILNRRLGLSVSKWSRNPVGACLAYNSALPHLCRCRCQCISEG